MIYAFVKHDVYQYTGVIEIGSRLVDDKTVNIDSPATVLAKLTEGYIPLVLSESANINTSSDIISPKTKIRGRVPMGSEIIVLEIRGSKEQGDIYIQLLDKVINKIKEDHMADSTHKCTTANLLTSTPVFS